MRVVLSEDSSSPSTVSDGIFCFLEQLLRFSGPVVWSCGSHAHLSNLSCLLEHQWERPVSGTSPYYWKERRLHTIARCHLCVLIMPLVSRYSSSFTAWHGRNRRPHQVQKGTREWNSWVLSLKGTGAGMNGVVCKNSQSSVPPWERSKPRANAWELEAESWRSLSPTVTTSTPPGRGESEGVEPIWVWLVPRLLIWASELPAWPRRIPCHQRVLWVSHFQLGSRKISKGEAAGLQGSVSQEKRAR